MESRTYLTCNVRVAVRIGTGGDAPHTGEELKGPQRPNSSGRGFTEI